MVFAFLLTARIIPDFDDVFVVEFFDRFGFSGKSLAISLVGSETRMNDLDGNISM